MFQNFIKLLPKLDGNIYGNMKYNVRSIGPGNVCQLKMEIFMEWDWYCNQCKSDRKIYTKCFQMVSLSCKYYHFFQRYCIHVEVKRTIGRTLNKYDGSGQIAGEVAQTNTIYCESYHVNQYSLVPNL